LTGKKKVLVRGSSSILRSHACGGTGTFTDQTFK